MLTNKRIAILTTSFGAGHVKAAQAIEQAMKDLNTALRTALIDSFVSTAPRLTKVVIHVYLRVLSFVPFLYGILYDLGNRSKAALWVRKVLSFRLSISTCRQLLDFPPHAIICTHASPTGAVCRLKKQGIISAPVIAVVTDFVVHRFWVFDEVDLFTVAHEKAAKQLVAAGVAPEKIRVTGIPIAAKFSKSVDKIVVQRKLGLTDGLPAVLIMGGGTGALPMDKMVAEFANCPVPVQLLAVAGYNAQLRARLNSLAESLPLCVFGFVDNIHELMAVADLIITKPGGLSTAEALAMGVPMLLYSPIPGQEEGNAQFLVDEGVACRIDDVRDLPIMVAKLLQDREQQEIMRGKAWALAKPHAAQAVAEIVFGLAEISS